MDGGQVSSGIRPQRVGGRRGVAKVGHKWGNLGLCWCGWQTVGSVPDENRFTLPRTRRVYYGSVLEAKKEIPDETNKNVALPIRTLYALPGLLRRVPVRPDFVRPDYAAPSGTRANSADTPARDPRRCHATGYGGGGQLRPGCGSSD